MFSYASGYAEMYERFCNKMSFWTSIPFFDKLCEYNLKNNGYYLFPNEKIMPLNEMVKNSRICQKVQAAFFNDRSFDLENYLHIPKVDKIIGAPFKGFNCADTKYIDPRIIQYIGSSGMAAGNTIEEAINQGLSEIFEHYCFDQAMEFHDSLQFYELNLNNLQNPLLENIIAKIKANGNNIKILDLSYTFGYPVILSIVFNKMNNITIVNCGSFPVFDIALERVLTETYQNQGKLDDLNKGLQFPGREDSWDKICFNFRWNFSYAQTFPEEVFLNTIIKEEYNKDVFLRGTYNNQEINDYYKDLLNKNNLHCYFLDSSLIPEMSAVWGFVEELDGFKEISTIYPKTYNDMNWDSLPSIEIIKQTKELFNNLENHTNEELIDFFLQQIYYNRSAQTYLFNVLNGNIFFLYRPLAKPTHINEVILKLFDNFGDLTNFNDSEIKAIQQYTSNFSKQRLLQKYIKNKYTLDEIKKIFINYDIILTDEDIKEAFNASYILNKNLFNPFRETLISDSYRKFVESYGVQKSC